MCRCIIILFFLLLAGLAPAQDSLIQVQRSPGYRDSVLINMDSILNKRDSQVLALNLSPSRRDTIIVGSYADPRYDNNRFLQHPFFKFTEPTRYTISVRKWEGKEVVFYSILALLIFFALIKNGFGRYTQDLFKTFFRTTIRQRQIKEQLLQNPLPSLLLNLFFLISVGMFLTLSFQYLNWVPHLGFWELFAYCVAALLAIYALKFLVLKIMGWVLQAQESMDTYIFVVFTTNKIMGIALVPFIILLAFATGDMGKTAFNLGIGLIGILFIYRYFLSYVSLNRQLKIGIFHFLLYLTAFEIAPLLLINKLLFRFLS